MYYMSGNAMDIKPRYEVDEEEFYRLKELSRARTSSKHYGKGLR